MAARSPSSPDPLVLIVEDDQATRLLYREYLARAGFRTADAHNGFQALEKARQILPDVVVTDLAVPGIDGFELCRALQQSADTRDIVILAVTGHPEYLEHPERFRHSGIARVLVKPCQPEAIVDALRALLRARGGREAGEGGSLAVVRVEDRQ